MMREEQEKEQEERGDDGRGAQESGDRKETERELSLCLLSVLTTLLSSPIICFLLLLPPAV